MQQQHIFCSQNCAQVELTTLAKMMHRVGEVPLLTMLFPFSEYMKEEEGEGEEKEAMNINRHWLMQTNKQTSQKNVGNVGDPQPRASLD